MAQPRLVQTVTDGGLGMVAGNSQCVVAKLGTCSLGAANSVHQFGGPSTKPLKDALGGGPLVDAAAHSLEAAGGPVTCVPVNPSVAGAAGAVTHTGTGTSVMTVTGAPRDAYEVQVEITRAAASLAALTAAFKYSLDGGDTFSPEIAVPANGSYQLPGTGLTLAFAEGTFVDDDLYKFDCTAPAYSVSDLEAAFDALLADPRAFGCVHVIGAPAPSKSAVAAPSGSPPAITLTGTPTSFVDAQVKITLGGALGVAKFKVSLDNGSTWGAEQTTDGGAPTYLVPGTGITLNLAAGTYVLDDVYSWNTYGSIAALFAAVDLKMKAATAAHRNAFAILELPEASDAILLKATAALASALGQVMCVGGHCELASSASVVGGKTYKRSVAWVIAARIAKKPIHEDLGRYLSGSVPGVSALHRDETATPALGAARIETLRTFPGQAGYFINSDTDGNMMVSPGSDFAFVQLRQVMDRALDVAYAAGLKFLNDDLVVDEATGFIDEKQALAIEADVNAALEAALVNGAVRHATAAYVTVKRDEAILSTKNLSMDVSVVPKAVAKTITQTLGFSNPALAQ